MAAGATMVGRIRVPESLLRLGIGMVLAIANTILRATHRLLTLRLIGPGGAAFGLWTSSALIDVAMRQWRRRSKHAR
jgi:hypothetical protein